MSSHKTNDHAYRFDWNPVVLARFLALFAMSVLAPFLTSHAQQANSTPAAGSDWPQFLGPNRNGISPETGLIDRWVEAGPPVVWRVPGGVGMSGLAIVGDRAVTMVQRQGKQWVIALRRDTGDPIWQTAVGPEYRNPMGDGPRATPSIDGDRVFVYSGEGILACLQLDSGKLVWSKNLVSEANGKVAEYGMACSPLVHGTLVVVAAGAPSATIVAVDKATGKVAWNVGDDPAGYSSPAILKLAGREQLVALTGNSVLGLEPATGAMLWRFPYETNFECNIATPISHHGQLFLSAGENHGSVMLRLSPVSTAGKDAPQFTLDSAWESLGPQSVIRNEWQTSLLLNGHLYGMDNVGGAGPITHLTCIEADTGKRIWQVPRFGKGNLIAADGKLFMTSIKGELIIARARPEKYDELGRITILRPTRQAPSLSRGHLFLRDDQEIVCVDIRQ
jgi:outer membrane protein assembly factor BamB